MKKSNNKTFSFIIILIVIIGVITVISMLFNNDNKNNEIITVKSDKELYKIYNGEELEKNDLKNALIKFTAMPFMALTEAIYDIGVFDTVNSSAIESTRSYEDTIGPSDINGATSKSDAGVSNHGIIQEETSSSSTSNDYSKTNIQVENVDEADIIKTDGNYIYSISGGNVVITNAKDPENIKIEEKISTKGFPEDLLIYDDKLVVIASTTNSRTSNTIVEIYDTSDKSNAKRVKDYELNEPYYTSRCIDNQLYVISSGYMQVQDKKVKRNYSEDGREKEISLNRIKYLKDIKSRYLTVISSANLDNPSQEVKIDAYLMDVSNAYVSENNIYLLNEKYSYDRDDEEEEKGLIKALFSFRGIFGIPYYYETKYSESYRDSYYGSYTQIYKFEISKNGEVKYNNKTETAGKTINQYSLDEKNNHLRVALQEGTKGTKIKVFDEDLNKIGETEYVGQDENMYSSRFMGDKAYLVTYQTIDPLFVIDLSNERNPRVLGELKIPGYSTYLHPYDENHIIGIGMQTKETVNRSSSTGRVTSTTAKITGMKMALFDVTDVNKPKQMSEAVIGDSRTTSAILTNPKALLFNKEKELLAIPVNNYNEDFNLTSTNQDSNSSIVEEYKNASRNYVSEGYLVYKINLEEGIKLKGTITHEKNTNSKYSYSNSYGSKLLRGLYIKDNLYTVSESKIKVNKLDTLDLIKELDINK